MRSTVSKEPAQSTPQYWATQKFFPSGILAHHKASGGEILLPLRHSPGGCSLKAGRQTSR